jgi:hypothetical protein
VVTRIRFNKEASKEDRDLASEEHEEHEDELEDEHDGEHDDEAEQDLSLL